MKLFGAIILFALTTGVYARQNSETRSILREYRNECRNTVVTVDEIVKDDHIKGHITGLPTDAMDKFKVVFYVKTNHWYVHPYTYNDGQEPGYSYSNLDENGQFHVRTVRRQVPSKELAVVVVPRSYRIVRSRWLLHPFLGIFGGILNGACNYTLVQGNGDFKSL